MANIPIALQMFTLRDDTAQDFTGTFKKVAEMGYQGVEFAGYGGMSAAQLRSMIDDLGLRPAGAHEGLDKLESDFDAVVDFHKELGNKYVGIPWLGEDRRPDKQGWITSAHVMSEIGHKLREHGLTLYYHNHSFEFQKYDGVYGLDLLYGNSDPEALKAQLDTYWIQHGGADPVAYIRKYAGRVPLIHLKDMAAGPDRDFAEVGAGIMDIKGIFEAAEQAGTEWMIVEQDVCKGPALESVKVSLDNIRKMGYL